MSVTLDIVEQMKQSEAVVNKRDVNNRLSKGRTLTDYLPKHNFIYKHNGTGDDLLCVPTGMQHELIRHAHLSGHFGVRKMRDLLEREYFIPDIKQNISCITFAVSNKIYWSILSVVDGFSLFL